MKEKLVDVSITSKEEATMDAYIETYTGERVHYDNLSADSINIFDIAHSLSQICRFVGHTRKFYSVAQHSILVCDAQETLAEKRAGLLHDASEAYVNDLPSPLKTCTDLGDYKNLENRIHAIIDERYNVNDGMTPNIKKADLQALFTEKRDVLRPNTDWGWGYDIEMFDEVIIPMSCEKAELMFLAKFKSLFPSEYDKDLKEYLAKVELDSEHECTGECNDCKCNE